METLFFATFEYVLLIMYFMLACMLSLMFHLLFPIKTPKITDTETFDTLRFILGISIAIYLIYKLIQSDNFTEKAVYSVMLGLLNNINFIISIIATILCIILYKLFLSPLIKIATFIVDKFSDKFSVKDDYKNQENINKIWDKTTEIMVKIHTKKSKNNIDTKT